MHIGKIVLYIWNQDKTLCMPCLKEVELSFQPYERMKFLLGKLECVIGTLEWHIDSGNFRAIANLSEEQLKDQYYDTEYCLEQAKENGWKLYETFEPYNEEVK